MFNGLSLKYVCWYLQVKCNRVRNICFDLASLLIFIAQFNVHLMGQPERDDAFKVDTVLKLKFVLIEY